MKTTMITMLAVGVLLVGTGPVTAAVPPSLKIGTPGSIEGSHLCNECRLADDGGPGQAASVSVLSRSEVLAIATRIFSFLFARPI